MVFRDIHQIVNGDMSAELPLEQFRVVRTNLKHHHAAHVAQHRRENLRRQLSRELVTQDQMRPVLASFR